jgi:hypothetical protein
MELLGGLCRNASRKSFFCPLRYGRTTSCPSICRLRDGRFASCASTEAKVIIEAWGRHYNEVRPHSSSTTSRRTSSRLKQQDQRPATQRSGALR